jgi:hypothetical protein
MARWNDLLAGLQLKGKLVNPYQYKTKGEMVADCADRALLDRTAIATMSCSSPAKHRWDRDGHGRIAHCGYCVPCLIRRAALQRGLGKDDTDYIQNDLWSQPLNSRRARGEHVRSFQIATDRLSRRPRSARTLIHQTGPLFDYSDRLDDFERVYQEGLAEVSGLLQGVVSKPL